jgi:hypothetical protein
MHTFIILNASVKAEAARNSSRAWLGPNKFLCQIHNLYQEEKAAVSMVLYTGSAEYITRPSSISSGSAQSQQMQVLNYHCL